MELLIGVISVCEFIDSANEILVDKTVVNIIDAITLAKIIFLDISVITLFSLKDLFQFIKGKN
ncbi:hypothetical protein MY1_1833 [Nitrosarchaeum koreense MY1]|uniref:Uncharacterized protein n=1 Tax=Nitrosarchaeum koreense MY1 TaxID=1001994 RepID=F9CUE4_9ARCH|nr:hypothetical protein MY1_1833 [Nitrosarchaeum koreense MY1]